MQNVMPGCAGRGHTEPGEANSRSDEENASLLAGCSLEMGAQARQLLRELAEHQVELEAQNEELRQVRQRLETALNQYTDLYEFSPACYFTLDGAGKILRANLAAAELLHTPRVSLVGADFGRFVRRQDLPDWEDFFARLRTSSAKVSRELSLMTRRRRIEVLVEGTGDMTGDKTGDMTGNGSGGCLLALTDITEGKLAAEALRQSEARHRFIVENALEGIMAIDESKRITLCNKASAAMLGYAEQELLGLRFSDLIFYEDAWLHKAETKRRRSGLSSRFERRLKRKDGSELWIIFTATPIMDETGAYRGAFGILTDISERKQVEEALAESTRRYQELLEALPLSIMTFDTAGRIDFVNQYHLDVFAKRRVGLDFFIGKSIFELPAVVSAGLAPKLERALHGLPVMLHDVFVPEAASGEPLWENIKVVPLTTDGRFSGGTIIREVINERKQMEEALRQSEARYRSVVEDNSELICRYLPDGRISFVNEAYLRYYGRTREDTLGKNFVPEIPEPDRTAIAEHLRSLSPVNPAVEFSHRILTPGGEQRWQQWTHRGIFNDAGELIEYQAVGADVTERVRAEQALADARRFLQSVMDSLPSPIFVKDGQGRIIFINEAMHALLGKAREEILGKTDYDLFPKEQADFFRKRDEIVLKSGGEDITEDILRDAAGSARTLLARRNRFVDQSGRGFLVGIVHDITERKRMEEALRESEQLQRLVLETAGDGIWMIDDNGLTTFVNTFMADLLGYLPDEMLARPAADFLFPEDRDHFEAMRSERASGRIRRYERRLRKKDGSELWTIAGTAPLPGPDGTVRGGFSMFTDITARKLAEQALERSEERWRSILETAIDGFWLTDTQGRLREVNAAYCRMSGYSESELTDMNIADLEANEGPGEVAAHLERGIKQGWDSFETRHRRKDGSLFDVAVKFRFNPGEGGYFVVFSEDITERKRVLQALRESETKFRIVSDFAYDWEMWLGPQGEIRSISPSCERITGYAARDFEQRPELIEEIVHPGDLAAYRAHVDEFRHACEPSWMEYRIVTKAGKTLWLSHHCQGVLGDDGRHLGRRVSNRNITLRKQAEEARILSEKRYRDLFEKSLDAIAIKESFPPRVRFANAAFAELFGYDDVALTLDSQTFCSHIYAQDQDLVLANLENLASGRAPSIRFEARITRTDGEIRWVDAQGVHTEHDGRPAGLVFYRDISERKRAERFREDVERIIRHDIKGPLGNVYTMTQLALEYWMDDGFRAMAPALLHGVQQVINLVDSSEKITLMEQGGYRPTAKWFDAASMLGQVEKSLAQLAKACEVHLAWMVTPGRDRDFLETPLVYGEEFLIEDMLMNLTKNAIEASPKAGRVTVECRISPNETRFVVSNQGAVPKAVRKKFFDKYITSGKTKGTGLGTYSAKLIANAHGGRVEMITSEAEGTTVTAILPRNAPASPGAAPAGERNM